MFSWHGQLLSIVSGKREDSHRVLEPQLQQHAVLRDACLLCSKPFHGSMIDQSRSFNDSIEGNAEAIRKYIDLLKRSPSTTQFTLNLPVVDIPR